VSRNTDKITKALKNKGYTPVDIFWEPLGGSPIMCGPEGGWYVEFELIDMDTNFPEYPRSYTVMGYNIAEVLEEIEGLPDCRAREA
jgi:hypothetical protein